METFPSLHINNIRYGKPKPSLLHIVPSRQQRDQRTEVKYNELCEVRTRSVRQEELSKIIIVLMRHISSCV